MMFQSDVFQIARRQAGLFLLLFSVGVTLTVLVILFAPRRYHSQAKLLLRIGRENVGLDPTVTTTGETAALVRTRDSEVNTALQTMTSRSILEKVVDEVGEAAILRGSLDTGDSQGGLWSGTTKAIKSTIAKIDPIDDRERAILELQDGLTLEAEREASVVDVRYRTKTPELAQRVAEAWIKIFRSEHTRMNASEGSLEFFKAQEAELVANLESARQALQARKSEYGLVTVSGEQQILEHQTQWAEQALIQSEAKLAASRARLATLEQLRSRTAEKIVTSEAVTDTNEARQRMRDRLFALEIEERNLAARYNEDHPIYQATWEQLEKARSVYESQRDDASQVVQGVNPLHITMMEQLSSETANVHALEAQVEATESLLAKLAEDLAKLNAHEVELAALERDVEVLELQFRTQYKKREQARFAAELESRQISNINVIQQPSFERRPVSPNKKLCLLLGLLGSTLAAAGCATLREANYQMGHSPVHRLGPDAKEIAIPNPHAEPLEEFATNRAC